MQLFKNGPTLSLPVQNAEDQYNTVTHLVAVSHCTVQPGFSAINLSGNIVLPGGSITGVAFAFTGSI